MQVPRVPEKLCPSSTFTAITISVSKLEIAKESTDLVELSAFTTASNCNSIRVFGHADDSPVTFNGLSFGRAKTDRHATNRG